MPNKILIDLDQALAWGRGKKRIRVRLPDGSCAHMSVREYRAACETLERLRAYRGKPDAAHGAQPNQFR